LIATGWSEPVPGRELHPLKSNAFHGALFRQLDELLADAGVDKTAIVSARLYLQHVTRDIAEVNAVYKEYFGYHPPNRRAYGVDLQSGMLVEAAFVAELS
jgi:enamine deaminase RidA (YjgF/YER057c/UK114 family)